MSNKYFEPEYADCGYVEKNECFEVTYEKQSIDVISQKVTLLQALENRLKLSIYEKDFIIPRMDNDI